MQPSEVTVELPAYGGPPPSSPRARSRLPARPSIAMASVPPAPSLVNAGQTGHRNTIAAGSMSPPVEHVDKKKKMSRLCGGRSLLCLHEARAVRYTRLSVSPSRYWPSLALSLALCLAPPRRTPLPRWTPSASSPRTGRTYLTFAATAGPLLHANFRDALPSWTVALRNARSAPFVPSGPGSHICTGTQPRLRRT